jgi:hypothetical protein
MAAIFTYFSALNNGELDESYHIWFFVAAVLGSMLVAIGILLEADWPISRMKIRERWGITLVIVGVVIEASFTFALLTFDEGVSRKQQSKIADIGTQLVARTEELIEVRKLTADRNLTLEEKKSSAKSLSAFRDQPAKIVIFPVNFESVFITHEIYGVILDAHWEISPPETLLRPPNDILIQGLLIESSDDRASTSAADALLEALKSIGVSAIEARGRHSIPEEKLFDHSTPLVWVLVGDKPTPLLEFIKP